MGKQRRSASSKVSEKRLGRILCACDAADASRRLAHFLQHWSSEVIYVSNGRNCVRQALQAEQQGAPFDLVIVDVHLEGIDGYSTAALLRENGYLRPIVSMSPEKMPFYEIDSESSGCDSHITHADLDSDLSPLLSSLGKGPYC